MEKDELNSLLSDENNNRIKNKNNMMKAMRTIFATILLGIFCPSLYAQLDTLYWVEQKCKIEELTSKMSKLQILIEQRKTEIISLENRSKLVEERIDSLNRSVGDNKNDIIVIADDLGEKIETIQLNTDTQMFLLGDSVEKTRFYWLIATLIMSLLGLLMYLFLRKNIKSSKVNVEEQIQNTKKVLEEEGLKLDNRLVEVLETQLKLKQKEIQSASSAIDHSLALKVADEIVRMQKNIFRIDENTKGLKPLIKGIERIQNNFASNGYEMINLLNKDYDERMNIDVINFITDENLSKGRKVITAVIKPQVNYNGVLIQRAQVDVSQN